MSRLAIIDASSLLFRCFHATPHMTNSLGLNIGGIYGFINQILNIIEALQPHYCIVALDTKGPTWRHLESDVYKSTRKSVPDALIPQFAMLKTACDAFNLRYYFGNACEADDWIASCATSYRSQSQRIYIVTTDKDLLQLVGDNVLIYNPFKRIEITAEYVMSHWHVAPNQLVDLFALTGDASDCIHGAKGIGPKTAAKWLQEYQSLEGIFHNIDHLKPNSRKDSLLDSRANVYKARSLIRLRTDLDVEPLGACRLHPILSRVLEYLAKHDILLQAKARRIIRISNADEFGLMT